MEMIESRGEHILLQVKIVPGASRTRVAGTLDGRLKIAVSAPPEKGKANAQLVTFLAKKLGLKKSDIAVVRGPTQPLKTLQISGASVELIQELALDE